MISVIEYLVINLTLLLFLNNSKISFIYGIVVAFIASFYSILYLNKIKKIDSKEKDKYKSQFSFGFIIICLMIVAINSIYNIGIFNLLFGISINLYFIIKVIVKLIKKDLLNLKYFIKSNYLFDLYSCFYLSCMIIEIFKYQIGN